MNLNFDKTLNAFTRNTLLAAFAGGLALLSYAANESASKVPPALTSQARIAINPVAISGELMAHTCAACHGTNGQLGDESFAPLAGMPAVSVRQRLAPTAGSDDESTDHPRRAREVARIVAVRPR